MTEEEYAKFANERRQKYGGFVVGDEGDECVPARPDGFQIPTLPRGRPIAALCTKRFEIAPRVFVFDARRRRESKPPYAHWSNENTLGDPPNRHAIEP
jgi:hypothetical protein